MPEVPTGELIATAASHLNPHRVGDRLFGDVAATLATDSGAVFSGVCIDTSSGTGFCAEHAAIAAMVTAGEYRIAKIVAVSRDDADTLYVLPPRSRCREFIRQVDPGERGCRDCARRGHLKPAPRPPAASRMPPPLTPPAPSPSDNRRQ
jgi:cytidine deaminase